MRLLIILLCEICLSLATVVYAEAQEEPENIDAAVAQAGQSCTDAGGTPNSEAVLSADDLNSDGGEDWIVDYSKLKCDGAVNPMCGSGGCTLNIYLWDGGSAWNLAFDETVQGYSFGKKHGQHIMSVTMAGAACNRSDAESCKFIYRVGKSSITPAK